jgi:predicted nucleic acid-binding protein
MIVVSDTTPILTLLKINRLGLFKKLFGKIIIPSGVYKELTTNHLYRKEVQQIKQSAFIEVVAVKDEAFVIKIRNTKGLDNGESEAIALTQEINADLLLMDERKGRLVAKEMGLAIAGTLGVLLIAYEDKILTAEAIEECISALKTSGQRISDSLFLELLEKISCSAKFDDVGALP